MQIPLIPAFALTIHKAQGLQKDFVLFVASGHLFTRALAYVATSRCKTLAGLSIVGEPLSNRHFFKAQTGNADKVIRDETKRLRKFQGNTIRKGLKAQSKHSSLTLHDTVIPYTLLEMEYDDDKAEKYSNSNALFICH